MSSIVKLRNVVAFFVLFAAFAVNGAERDGHGVPQVSDLSVLARQADQRELPILLMFSAEHCPYCEQVKRDFLRPMIISGEYDERVLIRRVEIDDPNLRDFTGERISGDDLMQRYEVWVTPTVVFIDHRGEQLAEKVVGLTTVDYYGWYLDRGIDRAHDKLADRSVAVN